jgi:pimeloyl-ACP methyl ester carboxylesterase
MPPEDPGNLAWIHRYAVANGVRLHYVDAGHGPLVLLLHGFPDFWYSWRRQILELAAGGFQVIAPDLRGYNLSAKPAGVRNYHIDKLSDDVAALIRHAARGKAVVAGHDWGGGIAWVVAQRFPDLLAKLVILNAPHPAAFVRELHTWEQLRRSWYIFFFQLPLLPELVFRAGDYALLERTFRPPGVRAGSFSRRDVERYKKALACPGALTAAINYYRAGFRFGLRRAGRSIQRIDLPALLIWGEQDRYLNIRLTEGLEEWVPNLRVARLPDAGHWVHLDAADEVNRLLIDFLQTG